MPSFEQQVIDIIGAKLRAFWLYDHPAHLWQDTSGTIAVAGDTDPVARVDDLSGNGRHLLQATSGSRPAYRTDASRVVFDGTDDYLSIASAAFPIDDFELFQVLEQHTTTENYTGFYVFAPSSGDDYAALDALIIGGAAPEGLLFDMSPNGGIKVAQAGSGSLPLALYEINKTVTVGTLHVNGSLISTDDSFDALTSPHSGDFFDGCRFTGTPGFFAPISRRMTIMTAALTSDERSDLRDLINARYALW